MTKNILIISSSPRKNGNSERLAAAFAQGAEGAGHNVEIISLTGKKLAFCTGCLACQKTARCVIRDDGDTIAQKMLNCDVLVFATPVYYYCVSGQLKTMLDRANPLYAADYRFREVYLLATAADSEDEAVNGTVHAVQGWTDCFKKAKLVKTIFAGGVEVAGEIDGHPALADAYLAGKTV